MADRVQVPEPTVVDAETSNLVPVEAEPIVLDRLPADGDDEEEEPTTYLLFLEDVADPVLFEDERGLSDLFDDLERARQKAKGGFFKAGTGFHFACDVRGIWEAIGGDDEPDAEAEEKAAAAISTLQFGQGPKAQ